MVYIYIAAAVTAEVPAVKVALELIADLETQVKIQQLKELKVFNALRLSIEVFAEVLPEVLTDIAADVTNKALAEILAAEVLIKLTSGTELIQAKLV